MSRFSDRAVAGLRDAFQYRLGLCLEGMGHWDDAVTAYRKLASYTASPRMAAIALLGQARSGLRIADRPRPRRSCVICSAAPRCRNCATTLPDRCSLPARPGDSSGNSAPFAAGTIQRQPGQPVDLRLVCWIAAALDWDKPESRPLGQAAACRKEGGV